jgi:hypothetical protein
VVVDRLVLHKATMIQKVKVLEERIRTEDEDKAKIHADLLRIQRENTNLTRERGEPMITYSC